MGVCLDFMYPTSEDICRLENGSKGQVRSLRQRTRTKTKCLEGWCGCVRYVNRGRGLRGLDRDATRPLDGRKCLMAERVERREFQNTVSFPCF